MSEPTIDNWLMAKTANYSNNTDLKFPYSDYPRSINRKEFDSISLHRHQEKDQILDFWGEGRIVVKATGYKTGFTGAYNVNHQYQLVSNCSDTGRRIPNRIPTLNYFNVSIEKYVPDSSFHIITVMGSPINDSTAKEIARIINPEDSLLVAYGIDTPQFVENLKKYLCHENSPQMVISPLYQLPSPLDEVGPFKKENFIFRPYLEVVKDAKQKFRENQMHDCQVILQSLYSDKDHFASTAALKNFFFDMQIRNNPKIFALGFKLYDSNELGRELMVDHMNTNVVRVIQLCREGKGVKIVKVAENNVCLLINNKKVPQNSWQWALFQDQKYDLQSNSSSTFILEYSYDSKDPFRIMGTAGAKSYLYVGNVDKESFESAFFSTSSGVDYTRNFQLIPVNGGDQFKIKASLGESSYLASKWVEDSSYQWACFGTDEYINKNKLNALMQVHGIES